MITISKPTPEDAEGMNEVIKMSWYDTYIKPEIGVTKKDIDLMYANSEAKQIEVFRNRASNPKDGDITLVAKENDKVVGVIRLVINPDHVRVRTIYVHPDYSGKGIGTNLWNEVQKYLPEKLSVIAYPVKQTRSVDWYKKIGFVDTGEEYVEEEKMLDSGIQLKQTKMIYTK
jgi:ribosomal protein S18 acetylase RimI-like enzyme